MGYRLDPPEKLCPLDHFWSAELTIAMLNIGVHSATHVTIISFVSFIQGLHAITQELTRFMVREIIDSFAIVLIIVVSPKMVFPFVVMGHAMVQAGTDGADSIIVLIPDYAIIKIDVFQLDHLAEEKRSFHIA